MIADDEGSYGRRREELAAARDVSVKTVARWIRSGEVAAVNILGRVRIPEAEYQRVIAEGLLGNCPKCGWPVGSFKYKRFEAKGLCDHNAAPRQKPLSTMSRAELDALAAERGLDVSGFTNNDQLREALGMRRRNRAAPARSTQGKRGPLSRNAAARPTAAPALSSENTEI